MTPNPYADPTAAVPLPPPIPATQQRAAIAQARQEITPAPPNLPPSVPNASAQSQPSPAMYTPNMPPQSTMTAQPQQQVLSGPVPKKAKPGLPPPPAQKMTQEQSIHALKKAVGHAQETLLSATTVFPFTIFPDTVTLDREKLTISHRFFFRIAEVTSIRIEDILNITADVGPFFGSIKVSSRFFDEREPHAVHYLWRHDALRFKRVVQGYIISIQKGIDCTAFTPKQLADMLDELGQAAPDDDA